MDGSTKARLGALSVALGLMMMVGGACADDAPAPGWAPAPEVSEQPLDLESVLDAAHHTRRCQEDADCPQSAFCERRNCSDDAGVCRRRPFHACPSVLAPVCGCDGVTYKNDCQRRRAGVSKAHDGRCEVVCGGILGARCPGDLVCVYPPGTCDVADRQGVCRQPPTSCDTRDGGVVCGCDGKTYRNLCELYAAGGSVDHRGECVERCEKNRDCANSDYCAKKDGRCDSVGACTDRPDICSLYFQPVCGCDRQTYSNRCRAAAAGVNVAHEGPCFCGGIAGFPCPHGQVCDPEPGMCQVADVAGQCVTPEPACPRTYEPVCGCDGVTYVNDCERIAAGVAKDHDGRCERDCEKSAQCDDDEFCDKPIGCETAGTCAPRPGACPDVWAPVCGCDGQTYGNRCEAAAAGADVAREGECFCGGFPGFPCADGEWCDPEPGTCDGADFPGQCVTPSPFCPAIYDPVCGCDGKTYSNDCHRVGAQVAKDHDGRCECAELPCDHLCPWGYVLDDHGCPTCECKEPPHCDDNSECRQGRYCQSAACGEPGVCADRPAACPDVWQPVCGCDGNTYGNRCEAAAAGVNVAREGTCFCGGFPGFPCGEGEWCDPDPGYCDGADIAGQCVTPSDACILILAPVCGCDGNTYVNDCGRIQAMVPKDHDGPCACADVQCDSWCPYGYVVDPWGCQTCECQPPPGHCCDPGAQPGVGGNPHCIEGASCCANGEWACNNGDGSPTCPAVTADGTGALGEVCEACCDPRLEPGTHGHPHCFEGATCCGDGVWQCNNHAAQPTCEVIGHACEVKCEPVLCELYCPWGFAKDADGCEICECAPAPRCETNADCREGAYCQVEACGAHGQCALKPAECNNDGLDPVCSCEGETFFSRCDAAAAGANVAHAGACFCGGFPGFPCPDDKWCDPDPGYCDGADIAGQCVAVPDLCTLELAPVCGCDGKTYYNDCARISAMVAKDHDGVCACEPLACDVWCPWGHVDDAWGCATCECEPPPEHCCNPEEQPGHNGNPFCIEGATCCPDGEWHCNSGDGSPTCPLFTAADATDLSPVPVPTGEVCDACCNPRKEPGTHGNPYCFEGATCCGDGQWRCNDHAAQPTCDVIGHACEEKPCCDGGAVPECVSPVCCADGQWRCSASGALSPCAATGEVCPAACSPVLCTLACPHGFKKGPDGCEICACAVAATDPAETP